MLRCLEISVLMCLFVCCCFCLVVCLYGSQLALIDVEDQLVSVCSSVSFCLFFSLKRSIFKNKQ